MSIDHPIYTSTTIIKISETYSATGFFFLDRDRLYLVTNKHVICGEELKEPKISHFKIVLHIDASNSTKNEEVEIELFNKDGTQKWLEHSDTNVDIILIPVDLSAKYIVSPLNRSFITDATNIVTLFEKILVVGYPFGWYDEINNLPIVRVGHLSSPFKVSFKGNPWMIGDVITHPGMSGAPVIMYLRDPIRKDNEGKRSTTFETRCLLIGVYSGQFKIPRKENERPNLVTIWFPELILDILDNPK
jgi:S1-C subfamily serine protease